LSKTHWIACAATLFAASGLASAQNYDVSIAEKVVLQTIQTGSTPLTAGKSTIIRASLSSTGTIPAGMAIDGICRVFVGGVEIPESPLYSQNGPLIPAGNPNLINLDDSLNFYFIPPVSSQVKFVIEVNPAGPNQVPETNFNNNTSSGGTFNFQCRDTPEVIFVPIDYRPSGGSTPNLPDPALIEPGVGDNFIQGIFPGSDWEYRPYDNGSKLWTSSLSGSGSSLNSSLISELQLMNPKPDFIYGWVPGSLPYNGQASGVPGLSGIGNTQVIRHQRTFAHELGHLFGKSHNTTSINTIGVDVESHLAITQSLPQIKDGGKKDIMAAGLLTNAAWVASSNYNFFFNHSKFQCPTLALTAAVQPKGMYLGGVFDRTTGAFSLNHSFTLEGIRTEQPVAMSEADLEIVFLGAGSGRTALAHIGLASHAESCSTVGLQSLAAPFAASLPNHIAPRDVMAVEIRDRSGKVLSRLDRTDNAPQVAFTSPRPSELIPSSFLLEWTATDADGDSMRQYLRYSPDGSRLMPLGMDIQGTSFAVDMKSLPRLQTGKGYFELVVSDGLNTTATRTALLRPTLQLGTLPGAKPTTYILTPDTSKVFPKAATVLLHCSAWDLEDRGLTGASVVWSSDLDGQIATGRVTSTANLSVGNHLVTVVVTDSDGQSVFDRTRITITDRDLPGNTVTCQANLAFGGPGSSLLEVCGGDLSSGTTADLTLTGAASSAPMWLLVGGVNNPTPLFGGTILPSPAANIFSAFTDAAGEFTVTGINGGGGPASIFAQIVYLDGGQVQGLGISNAIRVDFLP
jgi:hypothetical protein